MAGSRSLTPGQMGRLAGAITKPVLKSIAEDFMGLYYHHHFIITTSHETLVNLDQEFGTDIHGFNRQVIRNWTYKNSGDQILTLARILQEASDIEGNNVNMDKVLNILGLSREEVQSTAGANKRAQPETASGTISGHAKELTASMVLALSKSLGDKNDLRTLFIDGLHLEPHLLRRHISDSREKYTDAAYNLLEDWLKRQENRMIAYTRLYSAIKAVNLDFLIEEAKLA